MSTRSRQILVVEDEAVIQEGLMELLEIEGHTVATASNGAEAIEWLRKSIRPCVIILDLRMPVMDGFAFLNEMRSDESLRDIPVIVLSGDRNIPQIAAQLDVTDFLEKPIDIEKLMSIANSYCPSAKFD
jgi:two-component system chemotaxis response regulator CheY